MKKQVKLSNSLTINKVIALALAVVMSAGVMVQAPTQAVAATATTVEQIDWASSFGIWDETNKRFDPNAAKATLTTTTVTKDKNGNVVVDKTTKKRKETVSTKTYAPSKKLNLTASKTVSKRSGQVTSTTQRLIFTIPFKNRPDVTFGDEIDPTDVKATSPLLQILEAHTKMPRNASGNMTFRAAAYLGDTYWRDFTVSWSLYAKKNVNIATKVTMLDPDGQTINLDYDLLTKEGGGEEIDNLEWGWGCIVTITCDITPQ